MKTFSVLLAAVGLTAAFTYLIVSNHYQRERVERLRAELARVEADRVQLEDELRQAQYRPPVALETPATSQPRPVTTRTSTPRPPALALPPAQPALPLLPAPEASLGPSDGPREVAVLPVVAPVPFPAWVRYRATGGGSDTRCVVQGTSSLRDWQLQGRVINGHLDLDPRLNLGWSAATILGTLGSNIAARATVMIPVRSLKSQASVGATIMDRLVYETLADAANDQIQYRLNELEFRNSPDANHVTLHFQSRGEMVIRGVTNPVQMMVTFEPSGPNHLKVFGATALKMSDFKIKPPVRSSSEGRIEVGDDVVVSFDWVVARGEAVAAAR